MATIKTIKRRIKSATNISQITKAMEMVAASKMRRAQEKALASRPYALKLDETLRRMSGRIDPKKHALLHSPKPAAGRPNVLAVLVVSPEKGLCGGLNSNLFRHLDLMEKALGEKYGHLVIKIEYVAVGRKIREFLLKSNRALHAEFTDIPDRPRYEDILPISQLLLDGFKSRRFYQVYFLYTDFINTMTQKPTFHKLLPIDTEELSGSAGEPLIGNFDYIFEPDSKTILNWLLPYYFELEVYQKLLETQAAEHSARMVAMRNASDNAADIVKYLRLDYNRKRQQTITSELADIVTSRLAVD